MTREETIRILSVLRGAYPSFYRGIGKQEAEATLNLWQLVFSAEPYEQVSAAVLALIKTRASTFPPVPGEVTAKLQELRPKARQLDEDEICAVRAMAAWAEQKRLAEP